MSKYHPLAVFLKRLKTNCYSGTFSGIEGILGFQLPESARIYRAWWGNEGEPTSHSHCRAWLDAGFKISAADLVNQTVSLQRLA